MTGASDYYTVLGVCQDATAQDIRSAYKRLAKSYHPDRNEGGEALFKQVGEAYEVLGEEESRRAYDRKHMSNKPEVEVAVRAQEDAEKLRRREPISGYMFVGREKQAFEEMMNKDKESKKRREARGDLKTWAAAVDKLKEAEDAACKENAARRDAAETLHQEQAAARQSQLRQETMEEWEAQLASIPRPPPGPPTPSPLEAESLRQAAYEPLLSSHHSYFSRKALSQKLSRFVDKDPGCLPTPDLMELKKLLVGWAADVEGELRRREPT